MDIRPDMSVLEGLRDLAAVQQCSGSSSAATRAASPDLSWRDMQKSMASRLRALTRGTNVLFHGSPFWRAILRDDTLSAEVAGIPAVSFSRNPNEAAHWACLPREVLGDPGVLILDRASLETKYSVVPFDYWGEVRHLGWDLAMRDEAEEHIYGRDVDDVHRHLVGVLYFGGPSTDGWRELVWRAKRGLVF